jgi:defect-in-organelle-trafficking protein DotC
MPLSHTLKKIVLILGMSGIALSAFAKAPPPLTADVGFVSLGNAPAGSNLINPIRLQALQETALSLGARGALAWRSLQINNTLQDEASYLDRVFNFNELLINGDVLPPVITEADDSLNLSSDTAIRAASKIYRIVTPARFATTAPSWRTYLWMDFQKPTLPDRTLLPVNAAEVNVWNAFLKQGWKEGLAQANEIFSQNLSLLKRDYSGMVLYRQLLAQHMVSIPFVAHAEMGVTGDANEIRVNDQISRITAPSQLQPDSNDWTPVITH